MTAGNIILSRAARCATDVNFEFGAIIEKNAGIVISIFLFAYLHFDLTYCKPKYCTIVLIVNCNSARTQLTS